MKFNINLSSREEGNTLLVSLVAMITIGLALLTYMTLAVNQNQAVVHAQIWCNALPTAEAGIEDGLNHCNWNTTNWISNGCSLSGANSLYRSNPVAEGWYRADIDT